MTILHSWHRIHYNVLLKCCKAEAKTHMLMSALWSFSPWYCILFATQAGQTSALLSYPLLTALLLPQGMDTNCSSALALVAGQPSKCMRGKIDSWRWDISRPLTTQWLAETLILSRILIALYKKIMDEIQSALIHSLSIRSIFYLLRQLQKQNKWFWKHSLLHTRSEPRTIPFDISLLFYLSSSCFRISWVYPGKELPYLRARLWKPHCICCVCGALGLRLARPVHCFSAGQCFSFFCL